MTDPLTFTSRMVIRPEHVKDFITELRTCSRLAATEQNCHWIYANQSVEDPTVFLMYEQWVSEEAFRNEEMSRPYFTAYMAATDKMHAQERAIQRWTPLDPYR